MEPRLQKNAARLLLLIFGVLGLVWLARLDYSRKISTNVVDLIPSDEASPEITLLRSLADERQARIVLLALSDPAHPDVAPDAAASGFAAALKRSPLFAEATPLRDTASNDAFGAFLYQRRFDLLLPTWLAEQEKAFASSGEPPDRRSAWVAGRAVDALDGFLTRPEAAVFQKIVPGDPLLLLPALVGKSQNLAPSGGNARGYALVWARLDVSPLDEGGQKPVFAVIDAALAEVRAAHPGVALAWTGVNRFAAASKERIRSELEWLNILSMLAVLVVAVVFVRRTWKALHLVPVVLFSILGGWVAATMFFDRLHILVFVVGALLTGVAVDYGFYLYLQPALRPGERYREKLRRLLKPLLTSCLTTVIGFSFLLFSELPLIRQLGVFVSAGLISALVSAILYFAQLDHPYLEARAFAFHQVGGRRRSLVRLLGAVALVIALTGPWLLQWQDNIRQLEVPNTSLDDNDLKVRALFGDNESRTAYITRGASVADAREGLDRFQAWHERAFPGTTLSSLGLVLPAPSDYGQRAARLAALGDFENQFRAALDQRGYDVASFAPFFEAWRALPAGQPDYARLADDLRDRLSGPLGMLFFTGGDSTWFLSIADHPPGAEPPAELKTVGTNQLQTLNSLFARYRLSALKLSAAGLSLIGLSVFVIYGLRRGIRIFMIPSGSCLFVFGLLGATGHTLNMLHLLGAFLGVCLSHNYAIFSAENAGRGEPPPISIRLSALTTAASFGVLALSKIAVVAALGSTVALIVLTALAMVELEPLGRRQTPAR